MNRYTLYGIFGVLGLLLLLAILFLLLEYKRDLNVFPQSLEEENKAKLSTIQNQSNTWQSQFLKSINQNYIPAVEQFSMHFEVDASALKPKQKFYQLITNKNDVYSVFCLRQTLNSFDVKYSLTVLNDVSEIFLNTGNQDLLTDIVEKLKVYGIYTDIKEIWL